ncbi:MAG: hypothetical protein AB1752_09865 [Candidatus Zixiibacteriota bacterium]
MPTCPGYASCYRPTCGDTWTTCGNQATCPSVPTCRAFLTCNTTCPGCDCPHQGDLNADGYIDAGDVSLLIDFVLGSAHAPASDSLCMGYDRGDLDCDYRHCLLDVVMVIDAVWFGGIEFCDPCQSMEFRRTPSLPKCPFERGAQTSPAFKP